MAVARNVAPATEELALLRSCGARHEVRRSVVARRTIVGVSLGELERDVMDQLWAAPGPLTVREVHVSLAGHRALAYTTVMTVLDRLAKKGLVRQEREGRAFHYLPASSREELVAELMIDALVTVDDPVGRQVALVRFVEQVGPDEAAALRAALDGLG
jgi:predicted transcriptional regulator